MLMFFTGLKTNDIHASRIGEKMQLLKMQNICKEHIVTWALRIYRINRKQFFI